MIARVTIRFLESPLFVPIKWLGMLGLGYILLRSANFSSLQSSISRLDIRLIIVSAFLACLGKLCFARRWQIISSSLFEMPKVRFMYLLRLLLLADLACFILPSSWSGQVVLIGGHSRRSNSLSKSTATVVVDRIFGIMSLLAATMMFSPTILPFIPAVDFDINLSVFITAVAIVLVSLLAMFLALRGSLLPYVNRLNSFFGKTLVASKMRLSSATIARIIVIGILGHYLTVAPLVMLCVHNGGVPVLIATGISLISQLARSIPIALFGFTLSEFAFVSLAEIAGMDLETAVAVAVAYVCIQFMLALGGFFFELANDLTIAKAVYEDSRFRGRSAQDEGKERQECSQ